MKTRYKILVGIIVSLLVIFGLLSWYKYTYSMDYVESYQVNSIHAAKKVLIASQGSEFKNSLVSKLTESYAFDEVFFKVIDVSHLKDENTSDWEAIIILHTWENWEPPVTVKNFIDASYDKEKMVVVTTSGDGSFKMDRVDAITGESLLEEVDGKVEKVKLQLDVILHH